MNYELHYNLLIERAKNRLLECYTERHHIVPRCMGGSDDAENLVRLTAEEHYVAHQLLVKMNPGNGKLVYALSAMSMGVHGLRHKNESAFTNKLYGWIKRRIVEVRKGKTHEEIYGKESKRIRKELSEALKGRKLKQVKCPTCGKQGRGPVMYRFHFDNCGNEYIPWNAGKIGVGTGPKGPVGPQKIVSCPHCNKEGGGSMMIRWHFDNCKKATA